MENTYGYMGKMLIVDLTKGTHHIEDTPQEWVEKYLTGYGLGAKYIFENQDGDVGALDEASHLGFMSGILTGTKSLFAGRYCVVGRSPLTGTWGDANSGGHFAPAIKEAGFDGIFFKGISPEPVYLLINGGEITLVPTKHDNGDIWGMTTYETDTYLKETHGKDYKVSCIGPSGENQALLAGIATDGGRLAARSGLGAVMGSKNLKALCINGTSEIRVADQQAILDANKKFVKHFKKFKTPLLDYVESVAPTKPLGSKLLNALNEKGWLKLPKEADRYVMSHWGTAGVVSFSAEMNDSPVKNWVGNGMKDFPAKKSGKISNNSVTDLQEKKYGCYSCPMRCGGQMRTNNGDDVHKPEYETLCGFGTLLESDQLENIIEINHLLNCAGIDTISAATTIAWVYEMMAKDLLDHEKLIADGLMDELTKENIQWTNNTGALMLVKDMVHDRKIGHILNNGIHQSWLTFCEKGYILEANKEAALACGMIVGRQELPMHDPRKVNSMGPGLGVGYESEPTPGRHTSTLGGADAYMTQEADSKTSHFHPLRHSTVLPPAVSIGDSLKTDSLFMDLINGLGLCAFGFGEDVTLPLVTYINSSTGWHHDFEHYMTCAHRIKILRHSFNIRAGFNLGHIYLPKRIREGIEDYVVQGESFTFDQVKNMYFEAMGYDTETYKPTIDTLNHLDMADVIKHIYKED